jgi:prepilin-type N-terminal cleavage/methylation domain-containing protein
VSHTSPSNTMRRAQPRALPRRARRGLSLIEVLISLAIMAILLTAVASAFMASSSVIDMNDKFFRATQAGRVSVNQIMSTLRQCKTVDVDAHSLDVTTNTDARSYVFDSTNKTLVMNMSDGMGGTLTQTLAHNVKAVSFSTDNKTVSMLITVEVGNNSITLSGSAMPRRSVAYN